MFLVTQVHSVINILLRQRKLPTIKQEASLLCTNYCRIAMVAGRGTMLVAFKYVNRVPIVVPQQTRAGCPYLNHYPD